MKYENTITYHSKVWPSPMMNIFVDKQTGLKLHAPDLSIPKLNPFTNKPWFLRVCSKHLLKTMWEKEKLLITSNLSFSHSVFYPFGKLSAIFIKLKLSSANPLSLEESKIGRLVMGLTHYETTNFRLFQTERVCRQQFQIWRKWQKVIQKGRKHCGKRRNCSLRAISPFPRVFSKGFFPRDVKRCHWVKN